MIDPGLAESTNQESQTWRTNYKVIHRLSTVREVATLTPMLFKGQCTLFSLLSTLFTHYTSVCIFCIDISSTLLIFWSCVAKLLLNPFIEFLIAVIVFFRSSIFICFFFMNSNFLVKSSIFSLVS